MTDDKKWHHRFLEMAVLVSGWSKDPSTRVGAVIADDLRRVVAHGYNGFPRGVSDRPEDYENKAVKYEKVVHAEVNAILNARGEVRGCTLYSTFFPCPRCAAIIIQAGIKEVVYLPNPADTRYYEMRQMAEQMLIDAKIPFYHVGEVA